MKILKNTFAALSAAVLLSCSGNVDDTSLPVLKAGDVEIDLASETRTEFTVTYNGADVTGESVISSPTAEVMGNVFMPQQEGTYTFVAEYSGRLSNEVTVNVIDSAPEYVESKYDRHVCVIEFTGAWCINCPEGYDKMMGVLSKPSMAKYKENIHICAFHSDLEGTDTLAIPATQDVFKLFDGLAYPSFATDLRESGVLTSEGISLFQPSIMASFNDCPAHCGVAVSSTLNPDGTEAEVTARVMSEKTSDYRVVILVVQDRIKGWQKTPMFSEGQPDYNHSHVVRKVVTSYSGTFTGEKLTDDGRIAAGSEASKTWTVDIDSRWVLENTEVYAIVLDKDGYVNNMNVCHIDGGDSGYDLK
ncbi:MAG: Omp28-related outer membrane protein [Bacteroidales bacterium]|nr:Omp28-related outer membrane protein [Bacteroidales bacterium]